MTPQEIIDLLTIAAAWDNRKANEAAVHAWLDSATRARWTFPEAAEAIKDYYTNTRDEKPWVMPSHITAFIRATREDTRLRNTGRELAAAAITAPDVREKIDKLARRLEIPAQFRPSDGAYAIKVACPHCKAPIGQKCTQPSHKGAKEREPHPSRTEFAEREGHLNPDERSSRRPIRPTPKAAR
jgi:hypothetical protein